MKACWKVDLEDGSHAISAEVSTGLLSFRLRVGWDGTVIDEPRVITLVGQILSTFQRNGHSFVIRHSGFGLMGKLVLTMDGKEMPSGGTQEIAERPQPAAAAEIHFLEETDVKETEVILASEEYPLDNRFGDQAFTTVRQVSRESTNELSLDTSDSLSGKIGLELFSAIKGEIEAQVSHQIGLKIGEKFTESQTITFSVGAHSTVLYEVVWKRKVRTGVRMYQSGGRSVSVPYRVDYGLSFEVRTRAPEAS